MRLRKLCLGLTAIGALAFAQSALAAALTVKEPIPSQPVAEALSSLSRQTGLQVVWMSRVADGVKSKAIPGGLPSEEALRKLLEATGLEFEFLNERTVTVFVAGEGRRSDKVSRAGAQLSALRLAQASRSAADSGDSVAQEQDKAESGASMQSTEGAKLEEIIVTAQKRASNLQDVPVAVSALSEERLQRMGADSFRDFALSVPGLQMNELGTNNAKFVIRGITTQPFGGNVQETVITYIDDLPTTDSRANASTPDISLFDVERVEVLRGPQGTLFGSGAMGGAIRIITNLPDASRSLAKMEFGVDDTKGGGVSKMYKGMVNIPLIDNQLALRAVAYRRDTAGWIDNLGEPGTVGSAHGKDTDAATSYGGRVVLRYQPNDRLDVLAKFAYDKSTPEDSPYYTSVAGGQRVRQKPVSDYTFEQSTIGNLVVKYDFGWSTLKSSTTYFERQGGYLSNFTYYSTLLLPVRTATPTFGYSPSTNYFEELTLSSNDNKRWNWLAGAFYRRQNPRDFLADATMPGTEALLGSGINGAPNDIPYHYLASYDTEERAVFGELSYRITDQLEATVGARDFKHSIDQETYASGGLFFPGGPAIRQLSSEDGATNYKFSLSYKPTAEAMIYVTASQGYRVGSPNVIPLTANLASVPSSYGPDSLWNYEIGTKTSWLDHRLVLNAAVYYIDWADMQVTTSSPQGFTYIDNIGKAHSRGVELEAHAIVGRGFEYIGAASYTDAKIDVDNAALNARKGDRVPGTPKVMFSNTLQKSFQIAARDAYVQATHQYVGKSHSVFNESAANSLEMGGYNRVGLRGGIYVKDWEFVLHVDNLLDDDSFIIAWDMGVAGRQYYPLRPRTIGFTVRSQF